MHTVRRQGLEAGGWTHESALVRGARIDQERVIAAIQNNTFLVGVNNQDLVGCVQVTMDDRAAHIGMLAVNPSLQTSGIGKLLLAYAENLAAQELGGQIAVLVVIAARTELVEFYLRRGYTQTDERVQYPMDSEVGIPVKEAMYLTKLQKCLNNTQKFSHSQGEVATAMVRGM